MGTAASTADNVVPAQQARFSVEPQGVKPGGSSFIATNGAGSPLPLRPVSSPAELSPSFVLSSSPTSTPSPGATFVPTQNRVPNHFTAQATLSPLNSEDGMYRLPSQHMGANPTVSLNLPQPTLHYQPDSTNVSTPPISSSGAPGNIPLVQPTMSKSEAKPDKVKSTTQDGHHRWRKYGSKKAKGVNRAYFRCRNANCSMKMITETVIKNGASSVNTIYKGEHNHDPPQITTVEVHTQAEFKELAATKTCCHTLEPGEETGFAPKLVCTLDHSIDPLDDGFNWRKYGQKIVKGSAHPRSYFKCTTNSCSVKKQLEREELHHICTYEGLHPHPPPEAESRDSPNAVLGQKRAHCDRIEEWQPRKKTPSSPIQENSTSEFPGVPQLRSFNSVANVNMDGYPHRKFPSLVHYFNNSQE